MEIETINGKVFEIKRLFFNGWGVYRNDKRISSHKTEIQAIKTLDYIRASQ